MSGATATRPVGVDELRRAWHALQAGQFRAGASTTSPPPARRVTTSTSGWQPSEPVLPVIGCVGQAGATTLAVALATAAGAARVLECCSASASGLVNAATAELGRSNHNWIMGRRDQVWLARTSDVLLDPTETPEPDPCPSGAGLTVLDVGWDLGQVLACDGWIRGQLMSASTVVVLTTSTVPGLRRLEVALTLLSPARVVLAVAGSHPRRWPRSLTASLGPLARTAINGGSLVGLPMDKGLALQGLDPSPLPSSLLSAATTLLQHAAVGDHHQKGSLE